MFLVSNIEMLKSAIDSGIAGVIPSLNYLDSDSLGKDINTLNKYREGKRGTFGINLRGRRKFRIYKH